MNARTLRPAACTKPALNPKPPPRNNKAQEMGRYNTLHRAVVREAAAAALEGTPAVGWFRARGTVRQVGNWAMAVQAKGEVMVAGEMGAETEAAMLATATAAEATGAAETARATVAEATRVAETASAE